MKLPPSSLLASIALTSLPLVSTAAVLASSTSNTNVVSSAKENSHDSDTGILNSDNPPTLSRSLESTCPSTCSSDLCSCVSQYGYAEPCSQQLHDVCTNVSSTLSDCLLPEYVYYYQNVYCPFAACRVNGDSYESCQCESYINFCNIYGTKEGYENDIKTAKYCGIAACCAKQSDDGGRRGCFDDPFVDLSAAAVDVDTTVLNGTVSNDTMAVEDETATDTTAIDTSTSDESLEPIDLTTATGGDITAGVQDGDPAPSDGAYGKKSALAILVGLASWLIVPM